MIKFLRRLFTCLTSKEVVHFIPRLPVGMELSDGDKATLYGWPDRTIEDVIQHE